MCKRLLLGMYLKLWFGQHTFHTGICFFWLKAVGISFRSCRPWLFFGYILWLWGVSLDYCPNILSSACTRRMEASCSPACELGGYLYPPSQRILAALLLERQQNRCAVRTTSATLSAPGCTDVCLCAVDLSMEHFRCHINRCSRINPTPDKDLAFCVYCRCVLVASPRHYKIWRRHIWSLYQLLCQPQ